MKKKQKKNKTATPENQMVTNGQPTETKTEKPSKPVKYVVVRDGYRVSDKEYDSPNDPECLSEIEFWKRIADKFSRGESVVAVSYDAKKHRVW